MASDLWPDTTPTLACTLPDATSDSMLTIGTSRTGAGAGVVAPVARHRSRVMRAPRPAFRPAPRRGVGRRHATSWRRSPVVRRRSPRSRRVHHVRRSRSRSRAVDFRSEGLGLWPRDASPRAPPAAGPGKTGSRNRSRSSPGWSSPRGRATHHTLCPASLRTVPSSPGARALHARKLPPPRPHRNPGPHPVSRRLFPSPPPSGGEGGRRPDEGPLRARDTFEPRGRGTKTACSARTGPAPHPAAGDTPADTPVFWFLEQVARPVGDAAIESIHTISTVTTTEHPAPSLLPLQGEKVGEARMRGSNRQCVGACSWCRSGPSSALRAPSPLREGRRGEGKSLPHTRPVDEAAVHAAPSLLPLQGEKVGEARMRGSDRH